VLREHVENPLSTGIDDLTRCKTLKFVDLRVPAGTTEVWLTGSHVKGTHHAGSDRDVLAFHSDAPADPKKLFCSNQVEEIEPGLKIELVIAHPNHNNDPSQ
jgi:hypothetical protein